jgi:hypothetical protein
MSGSERDEPASQATERLERHARGRRQGLLAEYWSFLFHEKKWYLVPVVVALMALGALIVVGGTAAAPFLYTLF